MAPCRRRYSTRLFKALAHDPQLLVIRPAPTTTSLDHLKPFKLSTALMAGHKDCYAPIGLIQRRPSPEGNESKAPRCDLATQPCRFSRTNATAMQAAKPLRSSCWLLCNWRPIIHLMIKAT